MIERFNKSNSKERLFLLNFLLNNINYDFYYTEDNTRVFITDKKSLKGLFKNSQHIYVIKEKGDYTGVILVWKSVGGGKTRYYVKVNAKTSKVVKDLLTVLLWSCSYELFFKIKKDSKFLSAIKHKGFRFHGGRGSQILLRGKSTVYRPRIYSKDKDE